MKQEGRIEAGHGRPPPSLARLALVGAAVVFVAYAVAVGLARDLTLGQALAGSLANTVPTVLFALVAYRLVGSRLVGRPVAVQLAGHALLGAVYALLTYWLLIVLLGAALSASLIEFSVEPFPTRASVWQMLQNLSVYGMVAMLAYLHARPEPMAVILSDPSGEEPARALSRYFIRSGDDIKPIEVAAIVSIAGADDYAEVATLDGRHLVRITLAEFEKALDPDKFIRVHRSRIVNVERIERAEPAGGGRLLLHMEDGETIAASRPGSRLLRDRVI
jgi:two-component system, LytTR family, response regulator